MNYERLTDKFTVIGGPCSAESKAQVLRVAEGVKQSGGDVFRSGVWKPRTSADSWQGAGKEALPWLKEAKRRFGIALAIEVMSSQQLESALEYGIDLVWVGARSGTHTPLLDVVGQLTQNGQTIVMLKRGMGAKLRDWVGAVSYIHKYHSRIVLCERGITGPGTETRNVLDLQTAWLAKQETKLPVIIDPSHAAGRRDLILPMSRAIKAAGFDGLLIEVHPNPDRALTDAKQQLTLKQFGFLTENLKAIPSSNESFGNEIK